MFDSVIASIKGFGNFPGEELVAITQCLKPLTLRKDALLIKEGQVCRQFYFLRSGCLRNYEIQDDGNEVTLNLYVENDWVMEYRSLIRQQPAETAIQATEDSELFELGLHEFHQLARQSESFFRIGRIFEITVQNQDYQNTRLSPEEKYERLLATRPRIIQQFPLKYIASYLGITPETLSRVRRRIIS